MFSDRTESRARHFFKDILPEEAFTRKPVNKSIKDIDEEADNLIKEVLKQCEEIKEAVGYSLEDTSEFAENFDDTQLNVPLTSKIIDKILNCINPQKRGI